MEPLNMAASSLIGRKILVLPQQGKVNVYGRLRGGDAR
jgi:hypothetical protein